MRASGHIYRDIEPPGTRRTAVVKVEVAYERLSSSSCFAERVPHSPARQPPWRERLGKDRPGSRAGLPRSVSSELDRLDNHIRTHRGE